MKKIILIFSVLLFLVGCIKDTDSTQDEPIKSEKLKEITVSNTYYTKYQIIIHTDDGLKYPVGDLKDGDSKKIVFTNEVTSYHLSAYYSNPTEYPKSVRYATTKQTTSYFVYFWGTQIDWGSSEVE